MNTYNTPRLRRLCLALAAAAAAMLVLSIPYVLVSVLFNLESGLLIQALAAAEAIVVAVGMLGWAVMKEPKPDQA